MNRSLFFAFTFFAAVNIYGQSPVKIKVVDSLDNQPLSSVTVSAKNKTIAVTDSSGRISINLTNGDHLLVFSSVGYTTKELNILVPDSNLVTVSLTSEQKILDDVTVVSSTRNNQRIENSPLKVEVLGREEMDEENTIKPASIASILGDISGVQIQQSGVISGNANVRIQGLEGRYTQVLRDGMPLFDGFSGSFGILSIPPLDLKQVELIKGSASTLYGGGAIGGLVNIISRRPTAKQDMVFTLNQSTLNESNFNTYIARRNKRMGYTFFGGYTLQKAMDVNKDGFSDVGKMNAWVLHPRLFFYPGSKTTIIAGYTAVFEKRKGGDMIVIEKGPTPQHQYFENNKTGRHSGELLVETRLSGNKKLELKAGISSFERATTTNTHYFNGNQLDYFSEISLLIPYGRNSLVAGVNFLGERFIKRPSDPIQLINFRNNTIGLFAQNTWNVGEHTLFEAGLRYDHHNYQGDFLLPRIAFFNRFDQHWAARLGIGLGYKTPDPLATQLFDYAIEDIRPIPLSIKAERSVGYNAELNYKKKWSNGNEFFINHAFFLTQINHPVIGTEDINGDLSFSNASRPIITKGSDTYIQVHVYGWEIYAGYTYTIAERKYLQQHQFVPLTPKNRMAFTIVKEVAEHWRFGLEGSNNGRQYRLDGSKTPGYFFMAGMVERKLGSHVSVILNGENLFDYRQSRQEPLFTGNITDPSFMPLWAPIDGRVINLAIRVKL